MAGKLKILAALLMAAALGCAAGCGKSGIFPPTEFVITKVSPHSVFPTSYENIEGSNPVSVSFKAINGVPVSLKSYSIRYKTCYNQDLTGANLTDIPRFEQIAVGTAGAAGSEVNIEIAPYNENLIRILSETQSKVSPITAEITLNFKDINGNTPNITAYCLLHWPPTDEPPKPPSAGGQGQEQSQEQEAQN